ncbi:hypothetical protein BGZ61DRAFT_103174 [Ilyonectria robusta]|uniref:uncharacterized protein n=1 Tax=Ilyonectria robusta TaxID=1079257 RepID=UPI001E8E65D6|nr:uncharacterized protein BGZ61DRAFT_103174 [Ilyonectria robusta]KAH8673083.1 hypothetical protein BGZ61DRAFT_103174 [Ilyonectria robusta]
MKYHIDGGFPSCRACWGRGSGVSPTLHEMVRENGPRDEARATKCPRRRPVQTSHNPGSTH